MTVWTLQSTIKKFALFINFQTREHSTKWRRQILSRQIGKPTSESTKTIYTPSGPLCFPPTPRFSSQSCSRTVRQPPTQIQPCVGWLWNLPQRQCFSTSIFSNLEDNLDKCITKKNDTSSARTNFSYCTLTKLYIADLANLIMQIMLTFACRMLPLILSQLALHHFSSSTSSKLFNNNNILINYWKNTTLCPISQHCSLQASAFSNKKQEICVRDN